MLLLVWVVPLFLVPKVNSQQFTTLTSYSTTTHATTAISFSTIYSSSVSSATFTISTGLTVSPPSLQYCGVYDKIIIIPPSEAAGGNNQLHFSFTSTKTVDFMLFASMYDELDWEMSKPGCDIGKVANVVVRQHAVTSYSYDWTPPNGVVTNPVIVFLYTQKGPAGTANISVTYQIRYGKTVTSSETLTLFAFLTRTSTSTFRTTTQLPFYESNPVLLGVIIVIVLGIVILGALLISGLRAGKRAAAEERRRTRTRATETTRQAEKGTQFCINCSAELPAKSKFCNKCGSSQP
jgi:ribosomal protein L40E